MFTSWTDWLFGLYNGDKVDRSQMASNDDLVKKSLEEQRSHMCTSLINFNQNGFGYNHRKLLIWLIYQYIINLVSKVYFYKSLEYLCTGITTLKASFQCAQAKWSLTKQWRKPLSDG